LTGTDPVNLLLAEILTYLEVLAKNTVQVAVSKKMVPDPRLPDKAGSSP